MFGFTQNWMFQVHGGGEHQGGASAVLNELLGFFEGAAGHSSGDLLSWLLPGIGGMANLHPLVVHFPIALLSLFFVVELALWLFRQAQWRVLSSGLLYLGTLSAGLAVMLGLNAAETVAHDEAVHAIMEQHEAIGVSVLGLAVLLSLWRCFFDVYKHLVGRIAHLLGAGVLVMLLVFGADLGGLMVYHYGVAVQLNPDLDSTVSEPVSGAEPAHVHVHGEHSH